MVHSERALAPAPAPEISLRVVDRNNYEECFALRISADQRRRGFADEVVYSFAEAYIFPDGAFPFAVYADETIIGFVFLAQEAQTGRIVNFLIDHRFQGKGYSKAALALSIEFLRDRCQVTEIELPVSPNNHQAIRLYQKFGFKLTGESEDEYVMMRQTCVPEKRHAATAQVPTPALEVACSTDLA